MESRPRVLITTVPFGELDRRPLEVLHRAGLEVIVNPFNRKLTSEDLAGLIGGIDYLIAGTENITRGVIELADRLKLIARVGIGLDNVDLAAAREANIPVTYTPDAPSEAVADLTIGLMLSCLRQIHLANQKMHQGEWHRHFGRSLSTLTIGLVGLGRIGSRVARRLEGFRPQRILGHDLRERDQLNISSAIELHDLETLVRESDVVSLHIPLSKSTRNMFDKSLLTLMKTDSVLINTARGGIVNESDLLEILHAGSLTAAALDVFEQEPYRGPLQGEPRLLLTSHMGSMSVDSRTRMEMEASEEIVRHFENLPPSRPVPEFEYQLQDLERK